MTDSDRSRLDRIEQLLLEVLSELRGPRRKPRARGPSASKRPIDPDVRARARERLASAGIYVKGRDE